jgi:hypothetical protein
MFSPIVLKYNQKYFKLNSLYKINLYFIDQEHYIDISEVEKFKKWAKSSHHNDPEHDSDYGDGAISNKLARGSPGYDDDQRKEKNDLYILDIFTTKNTYTGISMEDYLLLIVEESYWTLVRVFQQYEKHLYDLSAFQKPDNTFKQIISPEGEIIYVVHFKKHINNIDHPDNYHDNHHYDIEISIDDIFDINHLYPLNLSKILNEKKIKDSPYT